MSKHKHNLIINKHNKSEVEYIYQFGNTKDIKLSLSEEGFSIEAELTKVYEKEEMLRGNGYLIHDAIRKAML